MLLVVDVVGEDGELVSDVDDLLNEAVVVNEDLGDEVITVLNLILL